MSEAEYGEWQDMARAPRNGTRILVEIRASEQGPAEVDLVRWEAGERGGEGGCVDGLQGWGRHGWSPN